MIRGYRGCVVLAFALLVSGCGATAVQDAAPATKDAATAIKTTTTKAAPRNVTLSSESGLELCDIQSLPNEADSVLNQIHRGGPFAYAGKDGSVFGNFEGILPKQKRGFYHEYTVPTPGSRDRGARRIITGGTPLTDPAQVYYTDDHYDSFCEVQE